GGCPTYLSPLSSGGGPGVVPPTPGHVTRGSEAPRRFSCGDDRLGVFLDQGADVPGAFRAHPTGGLDPADREVHLFPGRDPAGERLGVFLVGERVLFPVPDRVPHAVPGAFPAPRSHVPRAVLIRAFLRSPSRVPAFPALFPSACSSAVFSRAGTGWRTRRGPRSPTTFPRVGTLFSTASGTRSPAVFPVPETLFPACSPVVFSEVAGGGTGSFP